MANAQGISAFILKYRVPGNRDAAFCDAARPRPDPRESLGVRVDPKRIGIIKPGRRRPGTCQYGFYEASTRRLTRSTPCRAALISRLSSTRPIPSRRSRAPELRLRPTPPTFLLQAQDDKPYVDSSLAYFIALKAAGVPAEMHLFPDGGHGYGLRKRQKSTDAWPDLAATWLRRVTQ